jgi:CsoR family transcriptional regulator, copper-sensing transcriptional repressor
MLCDATLKNRIKRAKGQMQGVLDMMDHNEECEKIVTQLKAIRASIDKSIGILTTQNLLQIMEQKDHMHQKEIDDAINLIIKGI